MSAPQLVVVGTSAGGLCALELVLRGLPGDFPLPIVAVQHRAKESTEAYADVVGASAALPVREVEDGERLEPKCVYLAPPDYHVLVEPGRLVLSIDDAVSFSRPSIDVLFESAAEVYREHLLAVILTGANHDGAQGARAVGHAGGTVLVQHPDSAAARMMPDAALAACPTAKSVSLSDLTDLLVSRGQRP